MRWAAERALLVAPLALLGLVACSSGTDSAPGFVTEFTVVTEDSGDVAEFAAREIEYRDANGVTVSYTCDPDETGWRPVVDGQPTEGMPVCVPVRDPDPAAFAAKFFYEL